jgi:formylglycine-generating enzyme
VKISNQCFNIALQVFAVTLVGHAEISPSELMAPRLQITEGVLHFTVTQSSASRTYQLQWSDNMAAESWMDLEAALAGNGGDLVITSSRDPLAARRFYRMKLEQVPLAREGFALIPAGFFLMGDQSNPVVGSSVEKPVHEVNVSAFYMAKHEVTKALWDEVRAWAANHDYTDLPEGSVAEGVNFSKGAEHPVHLVSWWDIIKWCNARSEMEGLTPCYTTSGLVIRTGTPQPTCNWSANGYRLPSEAEWEKAARGGRKALDFPWGNTINHGNANYYSSFYAYEIPQDQGYHPLHATGGFPYTAPVGSFAPNGYGLYDMMGNVWEWCWDEWSSLYYSSSPAVDPRGPSSLMEYRVLRGGSWDSFAYFCRVAARDYYYVDYADDYIGFRLAYSLVP